MYVCMYLCMIERMYIYLNVFFIYFFYTRMYDVCVYLFGLGMFVARPGVSSSSAAKDGDLNSHWCMYVCMYLCMYVCLYVFMCMGMCINIITISPSNRCDTACGRRTHQDWSTAAQPKTHGLNRGMYVCIYLCMIVTEKECSVH